MAWCLTVLAKGQGVIYEVLVSEVFTFPRPETGSVFSGGIPLILHCESEVSVVVEAAFILIFVDKLHKQGVVSE